jgi:hypothetical protein
MDAATQYALAYALTTSAGLRGLLTLAVFSVAVHAGWVHPPDGFAWIGSTGATISLISVAALAFVGDKIPAVDHVLHAVGVIVKPAAAAILVGGALHPHALPQLLGLMFLGALNALGVHAASAAVRGTSTAFTGGVGNPFVSLLEDAISAVLIVLAFVAPFVAAAAAIVLTIFIIALARRAWRAMHSTPA